MKLLKRLVLLLLAIVALVLIAGLFLPKDFEVQRSILIQKPRAEVFEYIRLLKNQDNYGKWQLSDPNMKKHYQGTDGTAGFKYSWDSKDLGKGSQTILRIVEGDLMETELDFGFGEPAISTISTADAGAGSTQVTWSLKGHSAYPLNALSAIMSLFYDVGDDFDEGLTNLKNVLER